MRDKIRNILREYTDTSELCDKMTISTYEEGVKILNNVIGAIEENPDEWEKIKKPLSMWKEVTIQLRDELKTGMTGDSEVDESNTWWAAIQSTLCPKMENIIKENFIKNEKFINYVVNDYIKEIEIIDFGYKFETSGELRDIGYEDEMFEFAYNEYEKYGFIQDPEDEDSYYHEGEPNTIWSNDDMLHDMFYNYIDFKVALGEFIVTDDGWLIRENKWLAITKRETTLLFEWNCNNKFFSLDSDDYKQIDIEITELYAAPDFLIEAIIKKIIKRIEDLLKYKEKICN